MKLDILHLGLALKPGLHDRIFWQIRWNMHAVTHLQRFLSQLLHTASHIWRTISWRYHIAGPPMVLLEVHCSSFTNPNTRLIIRVTCTWEDSMCRISGYCSLHCLCWEVWIVGALSQCKRRGCIDKKLWYSLVVLIWEVLQMSCSKKIVVRLD